MDNLLEPIYSKQILPFQKMVWHNREGISPLLAKFATG
jgi:hypothetical protein